MPLLVPILCIAYLWEVVYARQQYAGGRYDVYFPPETHSAPVLYPQTGNEIPHLAAFSFCWSMWLEREGKTDSIVSYVTKDTDNQFAMLYDHSLYTLELHVHGRLKFFYPKMEPRHWYNLCLTWDHVQDTGTLHFDGSILETSIGGRSKAGTKEIADGGQLSLGTDDGYFASGTEPVFMEGRISGVQLWDQILPATELANVQKTCSDGPEGNIIAWSKQLWDEQDLPMLQPSSIPCPP